MALLISQWREKSIGERIVTWNILCFYKGGYGVQLWEMNKNAAGKAI